MEKVNKFMIMAIAMVVIMIAAVGIDKGMQHYEKQKWEKEREIRFEQARADLEEMQMTISELAQDPEAIEAFIEENKEYFDKEYFDNEYFDEVVDASESLMEDVSDDTMENVSDNLMEDISANTMEDVSGNIMKDVSDNIMSGVSDNFMEDVSDNIMSGVSDNIMEDVSDNIMTDVSGNMEGIVSGNEMMDVSGNIASDVSGNTLLERRKIRGSYMETQMQNEADQSVIAGNTYDFSELSIACLGDSITQASNLDNMEDYQQYAYPTRLKEILGAESVTNLGIGGSSIGRYWDQAFVDRYKEIPQDTDLIIVMGGTNDGFCLMQEDLGTFKERKAGTFIGDLDELMRGLKENYPDAVVVFATPLPNVLHDMLRKERDYLLPQVTLVNIIKKLAEEYEIPVIDLYNSNILDTHDAAVIYNYMPDGVHCNPDGYMILAEHFAAELIKLYESENSEDIPKQEE